MSTKPLVKVAADTGRLADHLASPAYTMEDKRFYMIC